MTCLRSGRCRGDTHGAAGEKCATPPPLSLARALALEAALATSAAEMAAVDADEMACAALSALLVRTVSGAVHEVRKKDGDLSWSRVGRHTPIHACARRLDRSGRASFATDAGTHVARPSRVLCASPSLSLRGAAAHEALVSANGAGAAAGGPEAAAQHSSPGGGYGGGGYGAGGGGGGSEDRSLAQEPELATSYLALFTSYQARRDTSDRSITSGLRSSPVANHPCQRTV